MDEKVLKLMQICQDRTAAVVRNKKGMLILMPYDREKIEKAGYEKIWVGSPTAYFEDEKGEPKKYNSLPAVMLFRQLENRVIWEEKMYRGSKTALAEIRDAFLGLPSPRTITNIQKTIEEVKKHLSRLSERDRRVYLNDLKDLLALEEKK